MAVDGWLLHLVQRRDSTQGATLNKWNWRSTISIYFRMTTIIHTAFQIITKWCEASRPTAWCCHLHDLEALSVYDESSKKKVLAVTVLYWRCTVINSCKRSCRVTNTCSWPKDTSTLPWRDNDGLYGVIGGVVVNSAARNRTDQVVEALIGCVSLRVYCLL